MARIAVLAAASSPSTSSVGSASAYPRRCASASASPYERPPSIAPRMKFVVPLTMPSTRWTLVTTSASRKHLDHGDRSADGGLEAKLHPARCRCLEELRAAPGEELLVGRDDRAPRAEQLEHVAARRIDASHHLRHEPDRAIRTNRREVFGEHARPGFSCTRLRRVPYERPDDPQAVAGGPLDLVALLLEQPVHRGADGAVAEQRYGHVDGRHAVPFRASAGSASRILGSALANLVGAEIPEGVRSRGRRGNRSAPSLMRLRRGASGRAAPRRRSRASSSRPPPGANAGAARRRPCPPPTRGRTHPIWMSARMAFISSRTCSSTTRRPRV